MERAKELARKLDADPRVARLSEILKNLRVGEAFLVGGALRDLALGANTTPDLDVALPQVDEKLARDVGRALGSSAFLLDEETCAWRVGELCDLVKYRGPGILEDLTGRDFTVNAVAYDLVNGGLYDPLGGLDDVFAGTLRLCSQNSISEDPLRILRAYRFVSVCGFVICDKTRGAIQQTLDRLDCVSKERVRDEFFKILAGKHCSAALQKMLEDGVLFELFPFMSAWEDFYQGNYHSYFLLEHSFRCVGEIDGIVSELNDDELYAYLGEKYENSVTRLALLKFAALLHDIAKPQTLTVEPGGRRRFIGHDSLGAKEIKKVLQNLKVSKRATRAAQTLVAGHMRLITLATQKSPTARSRARYLRDYEDSAPLSLLLALADENATGPNPPAKEALWGVARELMHMYFHEEEPREPLLKGRDLIAELGLSEGKDLGRILKAVAEAEEQGRVNSREEALAFARGMLQK